jgi:4-amino-4-deoxychorismate lyase
MNASAPSPVVGFYETFRTSGGRVHHWRYNRARLQLACVQVGINLPPASLATDEVGLQAAVTQRLGEDGSADAVFRYSITGEADTPLSSSAGLREALHVRPLPAPSPLGGIVLRVLRVAREKSDLLPRPKILHDPEIAAASAELQPRATAVSDEGLLLSREGGHVVETTRQNLFWIVGGRVFHPAPAAGGVAGTCLAWLLENGLTSEPVCASLVTLAAADAVAVCNSVRGVTPVRELWDVQDRQCLRTYDSAAHSVVQQLAAAWSEALARTATGSPA